jgi:FkbM family methyltransferase
MSRALKDLVKATLKRFSVGITTYSHLQQLEKNYRASDDIELLLELPDRHTAQLLRSLRDSRSQWRQDLFVLSELDFKRKGFFVEFGAFNGVDSSNTYLLEKKFEWDGILAEPDRRWHTDLRNNRTCRIETDCVWRDSNSTLTFNQVEGSGGGGGLSTIDSFSASDEHRQSRKHGIKYSVKTISLEDLLDKHGAPKKIDYLSIDTEGSEFEILSSFDFDKYQFKVITVEYAVEPKREKLFELLTRYGYGRKLEKVSKFDDWYVKAD